MVLISIILPVYNSVKYLSECLDSIRNQTFVDFEVLMIDDCSTDESTKILHSISAIDKRFLNYKNSQNMGPSYSRNLGIKLARGKYLFFVDSDDVLDKDCLKILYNLLTENSADISICSFQMFKEHYVQDKKEINFVKLSKNEIIKEIATCSKIQNFAWGKLYKKDLFANVSFPIGKIFEDVYPITFVCSKASATIYTSKELYYYRQNPTSASKTLELKKIRDFFDAMESKGNFIFENYPNILKYMSQSFFELFYLLKEYKINKSKITNYLEVKKLYKLAIKNAPIKQKIKYLLAVK